MRTPLLALIAAAAACGSSDEMSGLVPCGPNGACATSFECQPSDGKCHPIATAVAASLSGLRWELPCKGAGDTYSCPVDPMQTKTATMQGTAGVTYDLVVRFRGVVETKAYSGGASDGAYLQTGGTPATDNYNVYELDVSEPPQTYYLNRGASSLLYCFPIDYQTTVRATTGATVTLTARSIDNVEIKPIDQQQKSILVPDVPPYPQAYQGQFIQMDVVSVAAETGK